MHLLIFLPLAIFCAVAAACAVTTALTRRAQPRRPAAARPTAQILYFTPRKTPLASPGAAPAPRPALRLVSNGG